jgi:hypothetical protein
MFGFRVLVGLLAMREHELLSDLGHDLSTVGCKKSACNPVMFAESTLYSPFEMSFPCLLVMCGHDFVYRRLSSKH